MKTKPRKPACPRRATALSDDCHRRARIPPAADFVPLSDAAEIRIAIGETLAAFKVCSAAERRAFDAWHAWLAARAAGRNAEWLRALYIQAANDAARATTIGRRLRIVAEQRAAELDARRLGCELTAVGGRA